jgi:hypothetical protein
MGYINYDLRVRIGAEHLLVFSLMEGRFSK